MKIQLEARSVNNTHTEVSVYMNDDFCGELCMLNEVAIHFYNMIILSQYKIPSDKYTASGEWPK